MKALTIREPWASLIMVGAKRIETRNWETDYRGPIAIHAAKGMTREELDFARLTPAVQNVLEPHFGNWWYEVFMSRVADAFKGTRGHVLATANLAGCYRIIQNNAGWVGYVDPERDSCLNSPYVRVDGHEYEFGSYANGRFAWVLADVIRLPDPIPATGALGLWDWQPPEMEQAA